MERRPLGRTGESVSAICLGTMTWGEQNPEAEAHAQLDYALDRGVDFLDTAEMYSVPTRAETQGRSEAIIGTWLAARRNRSRVFIGTKVTGPAARFPYLRDGQPRLDRRNITAAVEDSLKRLQTDYIDLYQLHWPERRTNLFGRLEYEHDRAEDPVPLEESLAVLSDLVQAGKVRFIGLSNETPWGVMACVRLSDELGLPRVASIQNAYNLVNRSFEIGLAEVAMREDVGLLAYSPMGGGTLSGKYAGGAQPPGARMARFPGVFMRYSSPQGQRAIGDYVGLARENGIEPAQMALAFVHRQPFVTSTIVGATSVEQLRSNIDAATLELDDAVLSGIEAIHRNCPNPCP